MRIRPVERGSPKAMIELHRPFQMRRNRVVHQLLRSEFVLSGHDEFDAPVIFGQQRCAHDREIALRTRPLVEERTGMQDSLRQDHAVRHGRPNRHARHALPEQIERMIMLPVALQIGRVGAWRDQPGNGVRRDCAEGGFACAERVGEPLQDHGPAAGVGRGLVDLIDQGEQLVLAH